MSRDSQRSLADPLFQPSARADSQMRRSPPIPFGLRAVHLNARLVLELREAIDIGVEALGLVRGNGESVMRNPIEIDYSHSRAIIKEIGERLRTSLEEDRELPASLRLQIDRLRQLEGQSQPNVERPTTRWWARRPRT
jgi:hypothetical protein